MYQSDKRNRKEKQKLSLLINLKADNPTPIPLLQTCNEGKTDGQMVRGTSMAKRSLINTCHNGLINTCHKTQTHLLFICAISDAGSGFSDRLISATQISYQVKEAAANPTLPLKLTSVPQSAELKQHSSAVSHGTRNASTKIQIKTVTSFLISVDNNRW